MIRQGSTGEEIIIDKDIFDEMYDANNPLPDKQDYESLEKYYRNKKYVYSEVEKTMNRKYREKFFSYMNKLATATPGPAIKEDDWTQITLGEKTKRDLEAMYGDYQKLMADKKQPLMYKNVNEYLKQWVLRLIYNNLLTSQDYPDEPQSSFASDEPEMHSSCLRKAMEASENSGVHVSIPVQRSTQNLLNRLRDVTFLETYDQVIIYVLKLIHSPKYRAYLASMEKKSAVADSSGHYAGPVDDNAAPEDKNSLEPNRKIRDVDDFIIDYIRLFKLRKST